MSEMFSQGEIDRIIEESWKEWEDEKKDDAISRQDAIAFMKKPLSSACAIEYLENAPSVQPIRPRGHWILTDDDFVYCSECEDSYYPRPIDASWYYCPHCGADMREETNHE